MQSPRLSGISETNRSATTRLVQGGVTQIVNNKGGDILQNIKQDRARNPLNYSINTATNDYKSLDV